MEKSSEIRDFVLSSYAAMLNGDFGWWERHLSQQDGVLMIGTDPDEWWTGYAAILRVTRPQVAALTGSTFEGDPQAYVEGTVGWCADNGRWQLPNGAVLPTGECAVLLIKVWHQNFQYRLGKIALAWLAAVAVARHDDDQR